jgi:HK97 family phage prohead protease
VEITAKEYTLEAEIKDMDIKQGIVTGYFSSFNTLDSDNDIILPNAFKRSIDNNGPESSKPRIKHLLNHDYTQPLGELLVLREDTKGLYYESKVGIHNLGVDFLKMVDSNLIKEHSIGFQITKWEKADKDGCRYLKELKLWEGSSLTAWGANEDTPMCGVNQ